MGFILIFILKRKMIKRICPVCKKTYIGTDWQILCKRCYLKYHTRLPAQVIKKIALDGRMDSIDTPEKIDYLVKTGYLLGEKSND